MSSVPELIPLPIDAFLGAIRAAVRDRSCGGRHSGAGAGKTTRVPPALVADGPVLVLQPRRVAARAIARRIADEQGWTLGREVGWHVRFERNFNAGTSLLVATEGILTARLQQDPMASAWRTIVIDEFHERSLHADVGLALAREAWRARDDLRLVVMSATLDAARVSAYLDDCPVIDVPGRTYPLDVTYASATPVEQAVAHAAGDAARRRPGVSAWGSRDSASRRARGAARGSARDGIAAPRRPCPQTSRTRRCSRQGHPHRAGHKPCRDNTYSPDVTVSSTPDCTRWRGTIPRAASTAWRPSA